MALSSGGSICGLKRSGKSLPSNCRITSGLRVVFGFQEKDAMESATRWRFGMSAELIPSTQNGLAFSSTRKGKILAQFPKLESKGS